MKKIFSYAAICAALFVCLFAGACSEKNSAPPQLPSVTFDPSYTSTSNSATFGILPSNADKTAWMIREQTAAKPTAAQVLTDGEPLTGTPPFVVTAMMLKAQTTYTVYAVAALGDKVSELASFNVTTKGYTDMLTLADAGKNYVSYHVEVADGTPYRHLAIQKSAVTSYSAYMDEKQVVQLLLQLYGLTDAGAKDHTIRDLQQSADGRLPFDIIAGMPYVVMVCQTDAAGNLTDNYKLVEVTLPEPDMLSKTVQVELVEAQMTEATFKCTPDAGIRYFYEKILTKAQVDEYLAKGKEALMEQIFWTNTSRTFEFDKLSEWGSLMPETDYIHYVVGIDDAGDQTELIATPFTTQKEPDINTENIEFSVVVSAMYYGLVEDENGNDAYNFYFLISDKPMSPDEYGEPVPDAFPCNAFNCDLYTTAPTGTAIIPDGTYSFAETYVAGTWHPDYTWAANFSETEYKKQLEFTAGTITVARDGENYRITLALETSEGKAYTGTFNGPLPFQDQSSAYSVSSLLKRPFRAAGNAGSASHR